MLVGIASEYAVIRKEFGRNEDGSRPMATLRLAG